MRVETRLLHRYGPGEDDWVGADYLWHLDGSDAVLAPDGGVDVGGTRHDVPAARECMACHGGRASRVLGVSAVQLSYDAPMGSVDLHDLVAEARLTDPPAGPFAIPGTAVEGAALGYLHANCSHCHNEDRPRNTSSARCFAPQNEVDFLLHTGALGAVGDTGTYRTARGTCIEPGAPGASPLISRIERRGDPYVVSMPPLATEEVDREAVALLRQLIKGMHR